MRQEDQAVGLRNIGNTCYFNSLLQIYYSLPSFVEKIFKFEVKEGLKGKDDTETKKIESGMNLIKQLKKMFGLIAMGNKSYVEPGPVLNAIVDDSANQYQIGDERDLREFNEIFLSRIQDAIKAVQNPKPAANTIFDNKTEAMEVDEGESSFKTPGGDVVQAQENVEENDWIDEVS